MLTSLTFILNTTALTLITKHLDSCYELTVQLIENEEILEPSKIKPILRQIIECRAIAWFFIEKYMNLDEVHVVESLYHDYLLTGKILLELGKPKPIKFDIERLGLVFHKMKDTIKN